MNLQPVSLQPRPAVILMAEDNPDHVFLTRESFSDARLRAELHHVDNGEKCLAFLRRQPPYENAPWPDLLLLDINMPRMDGYEVMEQIHKDPALRALTVIVMTTSASLMDVNRMYALGCKSYLLKPVDYEGFTQAIRKLSGYWLELVILPENPR